MDYLLNNENVIEEKIIIKDIPCIRFRPVNKEGLLSTVIFYHGWGSSKEMQRFRGFILCSLGYQVIIPDAIYHGERNPIDHGDTNNAVAYFWEVVLNNIGESDYIIGQAISKYRTDPDNISIMGHSMGGFTAGGVFTHNPDIRSLVVFNGSCNWGRSNEIFQDRYGNYNISMEEEKLKDLDPMNNLKKLIDRPILSLHGRDDTVVSVQAQRSFHNEIEKIYEDKSKIKLIDYPNLNHYLTTNMMEEGAKWLKKYSR